MAAQEIAPRDLDLFILCVTGEIDDLHAVAQRARYIVEHIGRADEHDLAQIEGHGEVVVAEGRVLLRVEHLEQRGGRVAVKAGAELVHLVEHEPRIARAGFAYALNDVAGPRARPTPRACPGRGRAGRRNTGWCSCPAD